MSYIIETWSYTYDKESDLLCSAVKNYWEIGNNG